MAKRIVLSSLVVIALILAGCATATGIPGSPISKNGQVVQTMVVQAPAPTAAPAAAYAPSTDASGGPAQPAPSNNAAGQRMVITNASLSIVVKDPTTAMDAIVTLTNSLNGWVVSSNLYRSQLPDGTEVPAGSITVRVPADKLTDTMNKIKGLVGDPTKDIRSEVITGQDVTKEYTDLASQLDNLQKAEKQLQAIMEQATKTDDVLNVFNQLTQVQSQIEVIQGEMKYYEESAAMSAISVDMVATASVKPPVTIGGWQPAGIASDAVQALINFGEFLVTALEWFGIFCLPIIIVLGFPLYFLIRTFIRWRKARKTVEAAKVAK
jgi:predicted small secreted protein